MTYLNVISFTEGGLIFVKIAIITNELFLFLSLLAFHFIVQKMLHQTTHI